ncbi:MAG TPA: hypothetical protein PLJ25_02860 [Methanothrix sp.]|nr:hypothetical protein [Methanothrix sp.]
MIGPGGSSAGELHLCESSHEEGAGQPARRVNAPGSYRARGQATRGVP